MESMELFFTSYNKALEEAFERFLEDTGRQDLLREDEDEAERYVKDKLKRWEDIPTPALGGKTPREFVELLDGLERTGEVFIYGAAASDFGLPCSLTDKLMSFGEASYDFLIGTIREKAFGSAEEGHAAAAAAISLLGERKLGKAVDVLIDTILKLPGHNELLMESIYQALIDIGREAVNPLVQTLEVAWVIDVAQEYMFMALKEIGKDNRSDEIYRCLRSTFLKMGNKILGALCIGEYGDTRGIAMLRGYAQKNLSSLDSQTYHQIRAAVHMLGGTMDDIKLQ